MAKTRTVTVEIPAEDLEDVVQPKRRLIPEKLTETGAQMTYAGMLGLLAGLGMEVLEAAEVIVSGPNWEAIIAYATPLLAGGGAYRQVNKRHEQNRVDMEMLAEDVGVIPLEPGEEFGPEN